MSLDDLCNLSLFQASAGLAKREFTPLELLESSLARIQRKQPELNAFIEIRADKARAALMKAARNNDDRTSRGPLGGIPLAHKDMFFRKGEVSTCGSKIMKNQPATTTSTILERLDAAGSIDLGTLNMSEFALGPTGQNAHFGQCRNPHSTDRISGGSSSGSGAAVAAGMVFGALGSDTAGSVRLPAALCGVVGLKPTLGRVSRYGAMPLSQSFDTFGVLARTVEDCAMIFDVIAGHDARDPSSSHRGYRSCALEAIPSKLDGLRVGRPLTYYCDGIEPDIACVLDEAIMRFSDLGAECTELSLLYHDTIADAATAIITSEAAALHAPWLETRPQDYGRPVRERINTGFETSAPAYLRLLADRKVRVRHVGESIFRQCDVFIAPVLDIAAPTIAETDVDGGAESLKLISRLNRKTRTINYLGFPAIAIPAGRDCRGMPVAVQIVGKPFDEALLFKVAAAFQSTSAYDPEQSVSKLLP